MQWVSQIFVAMVISAALLQLWLLQRQISHVRRHRSAVPEAFITKIELAEHQKAADYTMTKVRFGRIELVYSTILLLLWTLGGGLQWLDQKCTHHTPR